MLRKLSNAGQMKMEYHRVLPSGVPKENRYLPKNFLQNLFGELPEFFKSEEELRKIWSSPITRKALLERLQAAGYG